jgi:uncharacterized membrane protein
MAIKLRHTAPTGETRMWTLVEIAQGKPIERPIHPMLVHFPIAFYIGSLGLDVLSRLGNFAAAPPAATWLVMAGLVGFVAAAIAGYADRSGMPAGGKLSRTALRHALVQSLAALIFAIQLVVRWSDRSVAESDVVWIVLGLAGTLVMMVGADMGGRMVYKTGWRPSTD